MIFRGVLTLSLILLIQSRGTYSQECEDFEVQTSENVGIEYVASGYVIDYSDVLKGESVTYNGLRSPCLLWIKSAVGHETIAELRLTELSFTITGAAHVLVIHHHNYQEQAIPYDESIPHPEEETRITIELDEVNVTAIGIEASKTTSRGSITISQFVLKACRESEPGCIIIKCKSKDRVYTECPVEAATKITSVTLIQDFMRRPCDYHEYPPPGNYKRKDPGFFGYKDDVVWVDHGCRADFEVCYV